MVRHIILLLDSMTLLIDLERPDAKESSGCHRRFACCKRRGNSHALFAAPAPHWPNPADENHVHYPLLRQPPCKACTDGCRQVTAFRMPHLEPSKGACGFRSGAEFERDRKSTFLLVFNRPGAKSRDATKRR